MEGMSCPSSFGEQDSSEVTMDRISSLPWNVLDIILGKLSIIDAMRTSVLAKDWRYKWLAISKFILDSRAIAQVLNFGELVWEIVSTIINGFLLHHSGAVRTFSLKAYCSANYPDLYQWFRYLSKQHVEIMTLEEFGNELFVIPSYLFSFDKLQCLDLKSCAIRIPSAFERFNCLCQLILVDVSISDDDLHCLILACPLLVKLVLLRISGLEHLRISAPRLSFLQIDIGMEDIVIGDSACLSTVFIVNTSIHQRIILNWRSFIRCISNLDALEHLILGGDFIKSLVADSALEHFPLRNNTLLFLGLSYVRFENVEVLRVCLSLLSSCPNVKLLEFVIEAAKGSKLITEFLKENQGRFSFPQLDSITVTCPTGTSLGCIVNFIEFLCAHSPNLKSLRMYNGPEMNVTRIKRILSRFQKHCPHASALYTCNRRPTNL